MPSPRWPRPWRTLISIFTSQRRRTVQLDRCRAYCHAHGYEIAAQFDDRELSGGRADNRPGLQAAIEETCKLQAVLVVFKYDRFARNARESITMFDQLQKAGADLASVTEGINTRGAMGRAFYQMNAVFAELELNQIRERTHVAMQYHQANGRRMTRIDRCPYGTQPDWNGPMVEVESKATGEVVRQPTRVIDHPAEQLVIERIRELRAQGNGYRAIARALDDAGIDCRGGKLVPHDYQGNPRAGWEACRSVVNSPTKSRICWHV